MARADATPAGIKTTGLIKARGASNIKYPPAMSNRVSLGPKIGKATTPNTTGGRRRSQCVGADSPAETDSESIRAGTEMTEQSAHHDGRERECDEGHHALGGQRRGHARSQQPGNPFLHVLGRPQRPGPGETSDRQCAEQPVATLVGIPLREPAFEAGGTDRAAYQVDREQEREGIDRILRHLAQDSDNDHFVADSQQPGQCQAGENTA